MNRPPNLQSGQAMAEGVVTLALVSLAGAAILWLGHWQNIALKAGFASRDAAFLAARAAPDDDIAASGHHVFHQAEQRWQVRGGGALLADPASQIGMQVTRPGVVLSPLAQPGQADAQAAQLRAQWGLQDTGLLRAQVRVTLALPFTSADAAGQALVRNTWILRDAGHQPDAHTAQRQTAASALAWGQPYAASLQAAHQLPTILQPLDAAWQRPDVSFEWLQPWAAQYPGDDQNRSSHD